MTNPELREYLGQTVEVRIGQETIIGDLQADDAGNGFVIEIPPAKIDGKSLRHAIRDASLVDSVRILGESPEMID